MKNNYFQLFPPKQSNQLFGWREVVISNKALEILKNSKNQLFRYATDGFEQKSHEVWGCGVVWLVR